MTTYVPELNKKEKKDRVMLTVSREAYEALKESESDFCFDLAKLRAVAVFARNVPWCFQRSNSLEYFEDTGRRKELIDMFYALVEGFDIVSDYLDSIDRSSDSVCLFCSSAKEVK